MMATPFHISSPCRLYPTQSHYAPVLRGLGAFCLFLVLTACQPTSTAAVATPSPSISVFFPQQAPVTEPRMYPASEVFGELVAVNGCLRVRSQFSRDDTASYLVVSSEDAQLQVQNNAVSVLDETGQVVAQLGDGIYLGGGLLHSYDGITDAAQPLSESIPDPAICPGPYWFTSEGSLQSWVTSVALSRPNTNNTNPLIYAPQQAPVADSRAYQAEQRSGELVMTDGCLQIKDAATETSSLIVWPPRARIHAEGTDVTIRDGAGQLVARLGDNLELTGGLIDSYDRIIDAAQPLSAPIPKPTICPGPYWLVAEDGLTAEPAPPSSTP